MPHKKKAFYDKPKPPKGMVKSAQHRGLMSDAASRAVGAVGDFGEGVGKSIGHAAHDALHGIGKVGKKIGRLIP